MLWAVQRLRLHGQHPPLALFQRLYSPRSLCPLPFTVLGHFPAYVSTCDGPCSLLFHVSLCHQPCQFCLLGTRSPSVSERQSPLVMYFSSNVPSGHKNPCNPQQGGGIMRATYGSWVSVLDEPPHLVWHSGQDCLM